MSATHQARVRPGDRWDGVTLVVTRAGVAWASAVWAVTLRLYPFGPVILSIAPSVTINGDTATVALHISGEDTRKLRLGATYHADVAVQVPGAAPGDEPAFGPYTLFTWTLEAVRSDPSGLTQYTITWSSGGSVYNINLAPGGTVGPTGPAGAGFQLGDPLYIHPISRKLWLTVDGTTYFLAARAIVNGQPLLGWDESTGTTNPT